MLRMELRTSVILEKCFITEPPLVHSTIIFLFLFTAANEKESTYKLLETDHPQRNIHRNFFFFLILFWAVLGFELRASHLVGRHSTAWATPQAEKLLFIHTTQPDFSSTFHLEVPNNQKMERLLCNNKSFKTWFQLCKLSASLLYCEWMS
jgi:hypothetical protein